MHSANFVVSIFIQKMNFETIIFVYLTLLGVSSSTHHPKVYEDDVEYSKTENVRTARNSEAPYRTIHQPQVFNFQAAKQQDYLKFRYVAQQKANSVTMSNGMAKNQKYLSYPQNIFSKTVQGVEKESDDWQPFHPEVGKHNARVFPGQLHLKTTKDVKLYKPSVLKVVLPQKINPVSFVQDTISNSSKIGTNDLITQGSEIVEKKIDFRESPSEYSKIIFVPNQLHEQLKQNSGENLDAGVKQPETELSALNDLIGKNPNVQLEGLKRLLQDTSSKNYNFPVIQGPEPFQSRDHKAVTEEVAAVSNSEMRPNIQVNHDDNTVTIQTPHVIEKSSLEDLQKQLDEAAKIQTEKVLAQAQQEAQAQVEAQHKAIALAQVQAQKEALENIQKSIYGNAQALPLVSENFGMEYHGNTLATLQSQEPQPVPVTHNNQLTYHAHNPGKLGQNPINALENDLTKKIVSNSEPKHVPKKPVALYQHVPSHSYGSKELLYYAPNHHHQAVAQLQAQKALLTQVKAQNMAILQAHRNAPSAIRQILKTEQIGSAESEHASSVQSSIETEPQPSAYQHVILETNEDTAEEQKDYDDLDELQYAAKYAFGYRIKDAKEGNDFGHEERRNGKSLEGSYHVLLPDGRLQKVEYYADNSGYHAKVTYKHVSEEEGTI